MGDLPSPTEFDEARHLKKTRTEVIQSNLSIKSSYEDLDGVDDKHLNFEVSITEFAEQAMNNLGQLQKNFSMHVFDIKVRQLFSLNEDMRMDHFHSIKNQRTKWLT